jgi:hypothetical protein
MTAHEFTKLPLTKIPFRPLPSASATICAIKKPLASPSLWGPQ